LEQERQRAEEERELMAHARQIRRALLHIVPSGPQARAAAVIDLSSRTRANGREPTFQPERFDLRLANLQLERQR